MSRYFQSIDRTWQQPSQILHRRVPTMPSSGVSGGPGSGDSGLFSLALRSTVARASPGVATNFFIRIEDNESDSYYRRAPETGRQQSLSPGARLSSTTWVCSPSIETPDPAGREGAHSADVTSLSANGLPSPLPQCVRPI